MPDMPKFTKTLQKILLAFALIPVMVFAQDVSDSIVDMPAGTGISQPVAASSAEMVILVDNSTRMQALDADDSLISVLQGFITRNDGLVDISVMAFADDVTVIRSLAGQSPADTVALAESFSVIDYGGGSTDITRALERAVYELEYNGSAGIPKAILLISANSQESGPIAIPAGLSDADIELFSVLVGGDIAPQEMTNLPPGTIAAGITLNDLGGLEDVLMQLRDRITGDSRMALDTAANDQLPVSQSAPQTAVNQLPSAVNTIPVVPSTALVEEDRTRSLIIMITALLLILTLGALIVLLFLRSRKSGNGPDMAVTEACLRDIHGYTSTENFHLGVKATMLGRVAGKDSANIDYIVIPEATIGRRHAVIEHKDFGYWITDQGSINGTFVNDMPISSEIRLKHGDIVRLHKYEFQFVVPELDEAPATRVSETVMAGHSPEAEVDNQLDEIKARSGSEGFELDIDFSGDASPETESSREPDSDNETLLPGHDMEPASEDEFSGSEATLMPDNNQPAGKAVDDSAYASDNLQDGGAEEDETLMPANFEESADDATIRPNSESGDDEVFDITGGDKDKS